MVPFSRYALSRERPYARFPPDAKNERPPILCSNSVVHLNRPSLGPSIVRWASVSIPRFCGVLVAGRIGREGVLLRAYAGRLLPISLCFSLSSLFPSSPEFCLSGGCARVVPPRGRHVLATQLPTPHPPPLWGKSHTSHTRSSPQKNLRDSMSRTGKNYVTTLTENAPLSPSSIAGQLWFPHDPDAARVCHGAGCGRGPRPRGAHHCTRGTAALASPCASARRRRARAPVRGGPEAVLAARLRRGE